MTFVQIVRCKKRASEVMKLQKNGTLYIHDAKLQAHEIEKFNTILLFACRETNNIKLQFIDSPEKLNESIGFSRSKYGYKISITNAVKHLDLNMYDLNFDAQLSGIKQNENSITIDLTPLKPIKQKGNKKCLKVL